MDSLFAKVFNNPILVENILENVPDYLRNLNLRIVNKLFNSLYLRVLRRNYQRIKLEFVSDCDFQNRNGIWIHLNYQKFETAKISKVFRFLRDIASVKVTELIGKHLLYGLPHYHYLHNWVFESLLKPEHHHEIRTFIGLEYNCFECELCQKIIENCKVCEISSTAKLLDFEKEQHHYEKLILPDLLIEQIAMGCSNNDTREDCYEVLEDYLFPNISCDKLVLCIHEIRNDHTIDTLGPFPIPFEILDTVLQKLAPKSLEIKMIYKCQSMVPIRALRNWNSNYHESVNFPLKARFPHVTINLNEAYCSVTKFNDSYKKELNLPEYSNSIGTIRKLFRCEKITIKFSHWHKTQTKNIARIVREMRSVFEMDQLENIQVDVQLFVNINYDDLDRDEFVENIPVLPARSHRWRRRYSDELNDSKNVKWIGRQCSSVDTETNFIFNLKVFMDEKDVFGITEQKLVEKDQFFLKKLLYDN